MFFFYRKRSEDENKHKNIVDAQAPLHKISTDIFERRLASFFYPHKNKKRHSQCYPEKSLQQCLFDSDGPVFFAEQAQVKYQCKHKHNSKYEIGNLVNGHGNIVFFPRVAYRHAVNQP